MFSIIKDRVSEIKQDQDWKEKIAQQWNEAAEKEEQEAEKEEVRSVYSYSKSGYKCDRSLESKQVSQKSNASRVSMKSRIESEKEKKKSELPEWDRSTSAS